MYHKQYAFLAFAMYFITGVICMMLGSAMTSLTDLYRRPVEQIVLIGSAFALGRMVSVVIIGKLAEKKDPLKILFLGVCFVLVYMIGIVALPVYHLGFVLAFLGGIGMSTQDAICPLLLSRANKEHYSSALSVGQAVYGIGGFAISILIGLFIARGLLFTYAFYLLSIVGVVMLFVLTRTKWVGQDEGEVNEKLTPLYADNRKMCMMILALSCFIYCVICNALGSYMTSYMEALGASRERSSYIIAVYNLFMVAGSVAFTFILRKISETKILLFNSVLSGFLLLVSILYQQLAVNTITMELIGFFMGVLFSLIIAIATRIDYEHISVASANMAIAGSFGDVVAPLATSRILSQFGIKSVYIFIFVLFLILSVSAFIVFKSAREV